MMELAVLGDSKSPAVRRVGANPTTDTFGMLVMITYANG